MKLPEHQRPPFEQLTEKLNARVSYSLRQLFVLDVQNDCACDVEAYEIDSIGSNSGWYLDSATTAKRWAEGDRINLPLFPEVSNESIQLLLQHACLNASNLPHPDTLPAAILSNPSCDKDQLIHLLDDTLRVGLNVNRSGDIHQVAFLDFVPVGTFYLLPEPEFFGVISINVGGIGAFCLSDPIVRIQP